MHTVVCIIMLRLALLSTCILVHSVGCTDEASLTDSNAQLTMGKSISDTAEAGTTREYPLAIHATPEQPVSFDVVATALEDANVRVQVYGPEHDGDRKLLVAGGISQPRGNVELNAEAIEDGEHLIVVGSFDLKTNTAYELAAYCSDC